MTIEKKEILCIYHGNCADGFSAAWAVRQALGDVEFCAGKYQQKPLSVEGKHVIFVDFCYKPEVMLELRESAKSILVLDHHKSARDSLLEYCRDNVPSQVLVDVSTWDKKLTWEQYMLIASQNSQELQQVLIYTLFDMERSGAMIAWDFFHHNANPPQLLKHVQDRDLWKFELEGTKEIQVSLFSYEYTFENWDKLMRSNVDELHKDGVAIWRKHMKDINELIKVAKCRMIIGGHDVPVLNCPYFYGSEAGHILCENEKFSATYYIAENGYNFGLRSSDDGLDVSQIAALYGGGGHRNAAGFRIKDLSELDNDQ